MHPYPYEKIIVDEKNWQNTIENNGEIVDQ